MTASLCGRGRERAISTSPHSHTDMTTSHRRTQGSRVGRALVPTSLNSTEVHQKFTSTFHQDCWFLPRRKLLIANYTKKVLSQTCSGTIFLLQIADKQKKSPQVLIKDKYAHRRGWGVDSSTPQVCPSDPSHHR